MTLNSDIAAILEDTISVMFREPVLPTRGTVRGPVWSGTVHIAGGWRGTVTVQCTAAAARRAVVALVGGDVSVDIDVEDAFAEIANVVGGNAKAALAASAAAPCHLSLPVVCTNDVVGDDADDDGFCRCFVFGDDLFMVRVREDAVGAP